MKKAIRSALAAVLILPALALGVSAIVAPEVAAQGPGIRDSLDHTAGDDVPEDLTGNEGIITLVINILLFIIGIIAVIMLIIGGIMYAISGGDSSKVTNAKNTILYAVIGLIIAIFAYAIINWVILELLA